MRLVLMSMEGREHGLIDTLPRSGPPNMPKRLLTAPFTSSVSAASSLLTLAKRASTTDAPVPLFSSGVDLLDPSESPMMWRQLSYETMGVSNNHHQRQKPVNLYLKSLEQEVGGSLKVVDIGSVSESTLLGNSSATIHEDTLHARISSTQMRSSQVDHGLTSSTISHLDDSHHLSVNGHEQAPMRFSTNARPVSAKTTSSATETTSKPASPKYHAGASVVTPIVSTGLMAIQPFALAQPKPRMTTPPDARKLTPPTEPHPEPPSSTKPKIVKKKIIKPVSEKVEPLEIPPHPPSQEQTPPPVEKPLPKIKRADRRQPTVSAVMRTKIESIIASIRGELRHTSPQKFDIPNHKILHQFVTDFSKLERLGTQRDDVQYWRTSRDLDDVVTTASPGLKEEEVCRIAWNLFEYTRYTRAPVIQGGLAKQILDIFETENEEEHRMYEMKRLIAKLPRNEFRSIKVNIHNLSQLSTSVTGLDLFTPISNIFYGLVFRIPSRRRASLLVPQRSVLQEYIPENLGAPQTPPAIHLQTELEAQSIAYMAGTATKYMSPSKYENPDRPTTMRKVSFQDIASIPILQVNSLVDGPAAGDGNDSSESSAAGILTKNKDVGISTAHFLIAPPDVEVETAGAKRNSRRIAAEVDNLWDSLTQSSEAEKEKAPSLPSGSGSKSGSKSGDTTDSGSSATQRQMLALGDGRRVPGFKTSVASDEASEDSELKIAMPFAELRPSKYRAAKQSTTTKPPPMVPQIKTHVIPTPENQPVPGEASKESPLLQPEADGTRTKVRSAKSVRFDSRHTMDSSLPSPLPPPVLTTQTQALEPSQITSYKLTVPGGNTPTRRGRSLTLLSTMTVDTMSEPEIIEPPEQTHSKKPPVLTNKDARLSDPDSPWSQLTSMTMMQVSPLPSLRHSRVSTNSIKEVRGEEIDFGELDPDGFGFNLMAEKGVAAALLLESGCQTALACALEVMMRNVDVIFGWNTFDSTER